MSDLAARLKAKGLELDTSVPAPLPQAAKALASGAFQSRSPARPTSTGAAAPRPLALSAAETKALFTPLDEQGSQERKQEIKRLQRRKDDDDDEVASNVRSTLRRWVQDSLLKADRRDLLIKKGVLKCRVQAKWSEGLHEKLQSLAKRYGAKVAREGEKEVAERPAWEVYMARNEKWIFIFDVPALEAFLAAHPEVIDPPFHQVRAFVEGHLQGKADEDFAAALKDQFGPLREATITRARCLADAAKKGVKRKAPGGDKAGGDGVKQKVQIERAEDVAWAVGVLNPMGWKPTGSELLVRAPSSVAAPVLDGLKAVTNMADIVSVLKETNIGKVVNFYRHSPHSEIAKAAKDLVSAWREKCKA